MTDTRIRTKDFMIAMFNIKISPRSNKEDFTKDYVNLIKKLHSDNIAVNTRGEKFMEVRTLHSYDGDKVLYGKLTYYTMLDGKDWYNKRSRTIENVELDNELNPNAKEVDYFFIPEAHRFCFIVKSNSIAITPVEDFLTKALPRVVAAGKIVTVTKEITEDIIERILTAPKLFKLEVGLSYSNNDLTEDFEKWFDNDLRDGQVENLNLTAKSFKSETIDLENSLFLKGALKLSQSNGFAFATIQNSDGKNENVATTEYPRKERVITSEGNEPRDVRAKVLSIFRNG
jgi:hypothetical protein